MQQNLTEKKIYCNFFMKIKIISHNIFLRLDCRTQNSANMKKIHPYPTFFTSCFVSVCLFLISGNLNAQVEYGLKGGFTYSGVDKKIENSSFYSTRDKNGLSAGVWLFARNVVANLGLQTELLYTNKGYNYFTPNGSYPTGYSPYGYGSYSGYGYGYGSYGEPISSSEALHTLNLPVSIVFRSDKDLRFYVGSELGYLMKVDCPSLPSGDQYRRFSLGLIGGVQYQLTDRARADFRYNRSLTLLNKNFTSTTKLYPRGLEFSVMYKIGQLSKK